MKRKTKVCVAVACAACVMTGCGSAIPDMTEEQTQMVAEYSANLLLKYDKNYEVKVVDTTEYHEELAKKEEEAEKAAEEAAKAEQAKQDEENVNTSTGNSGEKEQQDMVSSIEEFYQLEGIQIQYSGFGIYDSYPEKADDADLFFALGATDGRKLMVMFFDVTNVSGEEIEFNMIDNNPKFRVSVNGGAKQSTLFTLLPDELAAYKGTLAADETVRTVIVIEIPAEESDSIENISLTLKNESKSAQLVLQ